MDGLMFGMFCWTSAEEKVVDPIANVFSSVSGRLDAKPVTVRILASQPAHSILKAIKSHERFGCQGRKTATTGNLKVVRITPSGVPVLKDDYLRIYLVKRIETRGDRVAQL